MNRVVKILMERDGLTQEEATKEVSRTASEIEEAVADGNYDFAEDIVMNGLGLEMDYIMDILMM